MSAARIVAVLPPIPVPEPERERRRAQYARFCAPGTTVDVRLLRGGPELTDREYELSWAAGFMVLEAERAAAEGAAGIVIDCTADPGLEQIAEGVDVPVVGALSSAVHLAMQLGGRFSILALDGHWARMIGARLRSYGLADRAASIEVVGAHVYRPAGPAGGGAGGGAPDGGAEFQGLLEAAGRKALDAGADSVILGSTTVIQGREELERALGVPVVAPGVAALKAVEAMIDMGLRPSRRAYPRPAIAYGRTMEAWLFPEGRA
ncbi:MAG: hypothetical protein KKA67_10650 [Spirochaetes bacterium]|nr:hypothetical protein [Spirochaetota bacterium]MBU1080056.1 hypothetical protein [Spirochaetota bacterium]